MVEAPPWLIAAFCVLLLLQVADSASICAWGLRRNLVKRGVTPPFHIVCSLVCYYAPMVSNEWVCSPLGLVFGLACARCASY